MILTISEILSVCGGTLLCGKEDTVITGVKTDSREIRPGDLFVPIRGERIDAHVYIDAVFASGAAASFTEIQNSTASGTLIYVENTLLALQRLAAYYRAKFSVPLVGITGSVGKTTTKEMIALALSSHLNVMYTQGNQNSQVGLPLTMFHLNEEHQVSVIEMGMSEFGEMSRLAAVARPTMAVMTNIGLSHIAQLKTQENILREKLHITDYLDQNGILFLNGDDAYLSALHKTRPFSTVTFGTSQGCDWRAVSITPKKDGSSFTLLHEGTSFSVYIPAPGMHNVLNAAASIAVASALGLPLKDVIQTLAGYHPPAMRQQKYEVGGITIIDDSYNASPDSMRSSINVLAELSVPGKKFAVLADMLELGEFSAAAHFAVGQHAAKSGIDFLLAIGKESAHIVRGAENSNVTCILCKDNEEAFSVLKGKLQKGDAVLVKGSRGMATDKIISALLKFM